MLSGCKKLGVLALVFLALLSSCKKKKPNVPPPQQQPPTITQPQPQPPQPQPQPPPQPQPQPQPSTTTTPPTQPPATATKPKPKTHKRHVAKKPSTEQKNNKTVVKEGGETPATGGQLSAGIPQDEVTHQRQTTAQLRQATENNLRGITRQLTTDEQAIVQQIKTFLSQSRAADNDGDTERAYNLAYKAHLLSDELAKR